MAADDSDVDSLRTSMLSISSTPSMASTSDLALPDEPPPYSSIVNDQTPQWSSQDPRSSSQQSLVPPEPSPADRRRKLLLVYIHGWMGNETSFQSFPAHVYNLVTILLANTHIVYSKIYPRYLSKKQIQVAANDFSNWLAPHESEDTDVILLGHSMGGVLAGEVALLRPREDDGLLSVNGARSPGRENRPLRHCIIGTINFDVPFLGVHPGIVMSGLKSLFRPASPSLSPEAPPRFPSDTASTTSADSGSLLENPTHDPNYNPSFANDTHLAVRSPLKNTMHFINKHADDILGSTVHLFKSHVEFGGALADFQGLKLRYCKIRMLEEDDIDKRRSVVESARPPPRIRFVNYYTISTGKSKRRPGHPTLTAPPNHTASAMMEDAAGIAKSVEDDDDALTQPESSNSDLTFTTASSTSLTYTYTEPIPPRPMPILTEFPTKLAYDYAVKDYHLEVRNYLKNLHKYRQVAFRGMKGDCPRSPSETKKEAKRNWEEKREEWKQWIERTKEERKAVLEAIKEQHKKSAEESKEKRTALSEMDKEARKAFLEAEKETEKQRQQAEHEERKRLEAAYKEQIKLDNEQRKIDRGMERSERKNSSKMEKHAKKLDRADKKKNREGSVSTDSTVVDSQYAPDSYFYNVDSRDSNLETAPPHYPNEKAHRRDDPAGAKVKKFCNLPPKDSEGKRDSTWVSVFMEDTDEIAAHCAIFFSGQGNTKALSPSDTWSERYANLIGDIAERIEGWVLENETLRLAADIQSMELRNGGVATLQRRSISIPGPS